LAEKQATANAQIVNGKVIQSKPGDGVLAPIPSGPGGASAATQAPGGSTQAASGDTRAILLRLVDGGFRIIAEGTEPIIMDHLIHAIDHVDVGIG